MSIEEVKNLIIERVGQSKFENTIKFDCGNDGILVINKTEVSTDDMPADCTVGVSVEDLMAMVMGELNPTMGFMTGKLKIDGSMGVAMKLGSLL